MTDQIAVAKACRLDQRAEDGLRLIADLRALIEEHGCDWLLVLGRFPDGDAVDLRLLGQGCDMGAVVGRLENLKLALQLECVQGVREALERVAVEP